MYNSLTGTVTYAEEGVLYLFLNGIEYSLAVPAGVCASAEIGHTVKIYTWLYHKEDSMRLFGFASENQREFFLKLLKVDGIGPKQALALLGTALALLGTATVSDLTDLITNEDVNALSSVPGIGAKKAAKIILALRGKLTAAVKPTSTAGSSPYGDLIRALAEMGFPSKQAEAVVAAAASEMDSSAVDFEQKLFREAIVRLSSV